MIPSCIFVNISWVAGSIGKYALASLSSCSAVFIQSAKATLSASEYECFVPSAELSDVPPEVAICSFFFNNFLNSEPAENFLLFFL